MIIVSVENKKQLNEILDIKEVSEVIISRESFDDVEIKQILSKIKENNKKATLLLETISRLNHYEEAKKLKDILMMDELDSIIIQNLNSFSFIKNNIKRKINITFNYNMNVYNQYTKKYLKDSCIDLSDDIRFVAPLELNHKELDELGFDYYIVYGYIALMVTKNCIYKNTTGCKRNSYDTIYDRMNTGFKFRSFCKFCYNKIYNSVPLDLRDQKLNIVNKRYDFTFEEPSIIKPIIYNEYKFSNKTYGHFNNSVK